MIISKNENPLTGKILTQPCALSTREKKHKVDSETKSYIANC